MSEVFRLDGRSAVVTGGTAGIGLAIARVFAGAGARVLVCGRDDERGRKALAELGAGARFHRADVTSEADCATVVDDAVSAFGGVDVLVNNAGPTDLLHSRDVDGFAGAISPEAWDKVQRSALTSVFLMTRTALPAMVRGGHGSIINITSIAAALAMPGFDSYAAAKAGVEAFTRQVAASYAHLGIRCNAIRVGSIRVDHDSGQPRPSSAPPRVGDEAPPEDWRQATPPSPGRPEDIAYPALFLASAASAYVNGAIVPVDGGLGSRSLMPWQTLRPEMA
jgi:NAD(P)-dependent dehydrogenase (short-subunit alcohol dehydrogenase family)